MTISTDDLRAAVGAGMVSEAQAASLRRLADQRAGFRQAATDIDEPFELFRGFNEIFIVVGLSILYAGWMAVTGLSAFMTDEPTLAFSMTALVQLLLLIPLTFYFARTRRMVAPSILLTLFTTQAAWQVGIGVALSMGDLDPATAAVAGGVAAVILGIYWFFFRIPFALFAFFLTAFAAIIFACMIGTPTMSPSLEDLFLLSGNSILSPVTLGLGLLAFVLGMAFDISDPHRVTRRAAHGFWMHVLAAPAIMNAIGLTLYQAGSAVAFIGLAVFVVLMAAVAVVIDRRSFLISGIGYMIALLFAVLNDGYGVIMLLLGVLLVLLGALWEQARASLLTALPGTQWKDRMPPWRVTP